MNILFLLVAILVMGDGVSVEGKSLTREIGEKHFILRIPADARDYAPGDLSSYLRSHPSIAPLYTDRIADLDRIFVLEEDTRPLFLGVKVTPYRKHLKRSLSFDEFASPEGIKSYERSLRDQLEGYGLSHISLQEIVTDPKAGIIRFVCRFETEEGVEAEEYYASIVGSHEIAYLILFTAPPSPLSTSAASFFEFVVEFSQFEQGYRYSPGPRNWWTQRTWGELAEILAKLFILFFFMKSVFARSLETLLRYPFEFTPCRTSSHVVGIVSIVLSLMVCVAYLRWVLS